MSEMTTLEKVYDRAHKMTEGHHDQFINVPELSFYSLEMVSISGQQHPLKPIAQQSIANRLGIPIHYLRKCPPDIQRTNINYWLEREKNDQLFFRFDGDKVRAIFTPRYIPTDNIDVLEKIKELDYPMSTKVQCSMDDEFMMVNIPDDRETFSIAGHKMTPGISISNSEVGLAALSISAFVLRLICTNGMISKTEVTASYRHISTKILDEFPQVLSNVGQDVGRQKNLFRLSLESKVTDPESTINNFNRQFQLGKEETEAVGWALPLEYGQTMFNVVNVYTKAAQYQGLPAESSHKLQKVGGAILGMVR
jgi:hypothetical protein